MASIENQLLLIAYITLAAVIAMIYGMRRIFMLERKIVRLERALLGMHHKPVSHRTTTTKRKTVKKKVKRRK
jgi:hypothetical protein